MPSRDARRLRRTVCRPRGAVLKTRADGTRGATQARRCGGRGDARSRVSISTRAEPRLGNQSLMCRMCPFLNRRVVEPRPARSAAASASSHRASAEERHRPRRNFRTMLMGPSRSGTPASSSCAVFRRLRDARKGGASRRAPRAGTLCRSTAESAHAWLEGAAAKSATHARTNAPTAESASTGLAHPTSSPRPRASPRRRGPPRPSGLRNRRSEVVHVAQAPHRLHQHVREVHGRRVAQKRVALGHPPR